VGRNTAIDKRGERASRSGLSTALYGGREGKGTTHVWRRPQGAYEQFPSYYDIVTLGALKKGGAKGRRRIARKPPA